MISTLWRKKSLSAAYETPTHLSYSPQPGHYIDRASGNHIHLCNYLFRALDTTTIKNDAFKKKCRNPSLFLDIYVLLAYFIKL
jgi:hypothetical protein